MASSETATARNSHAAVHSCKSN